MKNLKERICAFILVAAMTLTGILPNVGIVAQAAEVNAYFFVYEENAENSAEKIPVRGVELKIGENTYTTDEEGKCTAENVSENTEIIVSRAGYEELDTAPTVQLGTSEFSPQEIKLTMADIMLNSEDVILEKGKTGSVGFVNGNKIEDANNLSYSWSVVSGAETASIDSSTGVITANEKGTAKIRVERNGKTAEKDIVVKERFTMSVTADPQSRTEGGSTDVKVKVDGIPVDAGTAQVSVSGVDNIDSQEVSADNNEVTFTIPEGRYDVIFTVQYEENDSYFASSASTETCTYKESKPIRVADSFTTTYTYGDEPIDFEGAIVDQCGRDLSYGELDDAGKAVLNITDENKFEIIGTGKATVTIIAAANENYLEASVECEITVNRKKIENVKVGDISWNDVSKIYDGSKEVTLSGNLKKNGLVGNDEITISAKGEVKSADTGEYKEFDFVEADEGTLTTDKYEVSLDETEKRINGNFSINISPRKLYVEVNVKGNGGLSCEYGTDIDEYIQKNTEIALVDSGAFPGALSEDSGLIGNDSGKASVIEDRINELAAAKALHEGERYYVGKYVVRPQIEAQFGDDEFKNDEFKNYELAVCEDDINKYSKELEITQEVVTTEDILGKLNFQTVEQEDGYQNTDDGKFWVRSGAKLKVTSSDPNYTDVYLSRNKEGNPLEDNPITLTSDEKGNSPVNDVYVYLNHNGDLFGKTRTTSDAKSEEPTKIPDGKLFIDNDLPTVEFKSLGMPESADLKLEIKSLTYQKFSGGEYSETITVKDGGSGIKKVYSKKYRITGEEGLATISDIATSGDGWTEETGWSEEGTKDVNIPESSGEGYYMLLVKVQDNVGNEAVYASNGVVIDTTPPTIWIDKENKIESNTTYNKDIAYSIEAEDNLSSIDKIEVVVKDREDVKLEGSAEDHTNSFVLENLVDERLKDTQYTREELEKISKYEITEAKIAAPDNSSRLNMTIQATAYDKAGKSVDSDVKIVNSDTKAPTGEYSYDNNEYEDFEYEQTKYFKSNRIMTIDYTECNFNPAKATFEICVDGNKYETNLQEWNEELSKAGVKLLPEHEDTQRNNDVYTDERILTYKIEFGAESEEHTYEILKLAVEDDAGNLGEVTPKNPQEATKFVIDRKAPEIEITYNLKDNAALNGKYFNQTRVMTVTYRETYFDEAKVKLSLKESEEDDKYTLADWLELGENESAGSESDITVSRGEGEENEHVYNVTFGKEGWDADYNVATSMEDFAGNKNNPISYDEAIKNTGTSFTVDQKAPTVEVAYSLGEGEKQSYSGDKVYTNEKVKVTISITERNFSLGDKFSDAQIAIESNIKGENIKNEEIFSNANTLTNWNYNDDEDKWEQTFEFDVEEKIGDADLDFSITYKDLAGNNNKNYKNEYYFTVDKVAPIVEVAYSLAEGEKQPYPGDKVYTNQKVKMTVSITERNFSLENKFSDAQIAIESNIKGENIKNEEIFSNANTLTNWNYNDDEDKWEQTFEFDVEEEIGDADLDFSITYKDLAGNNNENYKNEYYFTVDKVVPIVEVAYSLAEGEKQPYPGDKVYTNQKVKMTVSITERNFSLENKFSDAQIAIESNIKGENIKNEEIFSNANTLTNWNYNDDKDKWEQTFEFDVEEKIGDADLDFSITYKDLAENSNENDTARYYFTVDKVAPVISAQYYYSSDEEKAPIEFNNEDGTYLRKDVSADYQITERNRGDIAKQIKVTYEGTDAEGVSCVDVDNFEQNAKTPKKWETDNDTIKQTFDFNKEANYTVKMAYTDLAGNRAELNYQFTIDWTAPKGEIIIDAWPSANDKENLSNIIYEIFTKTFSTVTMGGSDKISGVKEIYYYIDNTASGKTEVEPLSKEVLESEDTKWTKYTSDIKITPDSQAAIYEKIVDKAGNITYFNAEHGIIADDQAPVVELKNMSPTRNNLHYGDVTIRVDVEDQMFNGVYSGIEKVEYTIKSSTNSAAEESGEVKMTYNEDKTVRSRTGTGTIKVDAHKFNSNDVTVTVTAYDKAGNESNTKEMKLSIDVTAPVIEDIQWNTSDALNGKYYKNTRVATIRVRERNFDPNQVRLNVTNTDGTMPQISGWSVDSSGSSDNNINTCTVTFSADGDYNMNISCTDKAGNASNTVTAEEFTIDKTVPIINVSFDNNSAANGKYYNAARTATITVDEHNFNAAEVQTAITSNTSVPSVNGWSGGGDIHTATVPFTTDGEYSFTVNYTDLAGNAAEVYTVDEFVVDLTKPEIEIFDIEDKSANNGQVAPGVRYSDTNYDVAGVSITYSGPNHPEKAVDGARTSIPNGESIKMADFAYTEETDDVYTMVAQVTDLAGNSEEKQVTFSVNRFGSNFIFSDATEEFLDNYYNNEEEDLVVTEINVDTLTHRGITSGHDGSTTDLEEGADYTVKESGSEVSWKSYQYTISKENFEKEGMYSITIDSVDRATNQGNNKIKEADIDFVIDKTAPTVVITGIEDGGQYRSDTRDITISVADNVAMEKVDVYTNDGNRESSEPFDEDVIRSQNGEISYTITSSSDWQEIKAVAVDKAGNITDTSLTDGSDSERWMSVLVTSNMFVQFYRNTPLVVGTIIGIAVIGGGIFFLIFVKRRKKDEEQQQAAK